MSNTYPDRPLRSPSKWKLWLCVAACVAGATALLMLMMPAGCRPGAVEPADSTAESRDPEALVAALRGVPVDMYFDYMHGNPHEQIEAVVKCRFRGTKAVCDEIDRAVGREYIGMLYYCLGYVKDPASIPWLEKKLQEGNSSLICEQWLRRWWTPARGAWSLNLIWFDQPERWAAFFRQQVEREQDAGRRLALLKALAGWCNDEETVKFFVELEKAPETEGEALLVTQVYLRQHKRPFDAARLPAAIKRFRSQPGGNGRQFAEYAKGLRHEAFIPFLIPLLPSAPPGHPEGDIELALRNITFRGDISGPAQWQAWYEAHRGETSEAWLRQAAQEFQTLIEKDPKRAREFFWETEQYWRDRALLPWIRRWMTHRDLHYGIMYWIAQNYHPYWRDDLRPLARRIIEEGFDASNPGTKPELIELGLIKNDTSWEMCCYSFL